MALGPRLGQVAVPERVLPGFIGLARICQDNRQAQMGTRDPGRRWNDLILKLVELGMAEAVEQLPAQHGAWWEPVPLLRQPARAGRSVDSWAARGIGRAARRPRGPADARARPPQRGSRLPRRSATPSNSGR